MPRTWGARRDLRVLWRLAPSGAARSGFWLRGQLGPGAGRRLAHKARAHAAAQGGFAEGASLFALRAGTKADRWR